MRFFAKIENGVVVETLATSGSNKEGAGWIEHVFMHVNPGFLCEDDMRFLPPKPYNSFLKNYEHNMWDPPVEYPNDEKQYSWNEEKLNWEEIYNTL